MLRDMPQTHRAILFLTVLFCGTYFIAPAKLGGAWPFHARLHFAALAWLLPCLPFQGSRRTRSLLITAVMLLLGWQVIAFSARSVRFSREYATVLEQAGAIEAGTKIASALPYGNARYQGSFVRVVASVPEDIALRRGAIFLNSFFPKHAYYWVVPRHGVKPEPELRIDLKADGGEHLALILHRRP